MKTKFRSVLIVLAASLLVAGAGLAPGCSSSPDSRIRKNQALFDSLPPEAQASIRAGDVRIGFTPDMVLLALGEPGNRSTRTTQAGVSEVWSYGRASALSAVNFSIGMSGGNRGSGMSTGVGVGVGGGGARAGGERMRVVFTNGLVSSIESAGGRAAQ